MGDVLTKGQFGDALYDTRLAGKRWFPEKKRRKLQKEGSKILDDLDISRFNPITYLAPQAIFINDHKERASIDAYREYQRGDAEVKPKIESYVAAAGNIFNEYVNALEKLRSGIDVISKQVGKEATDSRMKEEMSKLYTTYSQKLDTLSRNPEHQAAFNKFIALRDDYLKKGGMERLFQEQFKGMPTTQEAILDAQKEKMAEAALVFQKAALQKKQKFADGLQPWMEGDDVIKQTKMSAKDKIDIEELEQGKKWKMTYKTWEWGWNPRQKQIATISLSGDNQLVFQSDEKVKATDTWKKDYLDKIADALEKLYEAEQKKHPDKSFRVSLSGMNLPIQKALAQRLATRGIPTKSQDMEREGFFSGHDEIKERHEFDTIYQKARDKKEKIQTAFASYAEKPVPGVAAGPTPSRGP